MAIDPNAPPQGGNVTPEGNNPEGNAPEGGGEGGDDLEKQIDARINAALGTHMTRFRNSFERDLKKNVETMLTKAVSPFGKQLEELNKKFTQKPKEPKDDTTRDYEARLDEERKKFEARQRELEAAFKQERELREATEHRTRVDEEKHALRAALSNAGITGPHQRAAVSLLYNEDSRVIRNEDGEIRFSVQKAGYTDEVSLDEGITDWLKTDEGKAFLPPKGAGGSGANGSQAGRPTRGPRNKNEAKAIARLKLAEAMGIRVPADQG